MATDLPGTKVSAPVVPFTEDDVYPTHDSRYGKGGWREVTTLAARNAIPVHRRTVGMVVNVTNDVDVASNGPYVLQSDLTTWEKFDLGQIVDTSAISGTNGGMVPLVKGNAVCIVAGQLRLADRSDPYRFRVIGLVLDDEIPPGGAGLIRTTASLSATPDEWLAVAGSLSLMTGSTYYLGPEGTLVTAPRYNPGDFIVEVCKAVGEGTMSIDIDIQLSL